MTSSASRKQLWNPESSHSLILSIVILMIQQLDLAQLELTV